MTACRTIRQLNILLGLLVLLASPLSYSAAPLCAGVFAQQSLFSSEAIEKTIENVARLKIAVDTAKSLQGGSRSVGAKAEAADYSKKLSALIVSLKGIKSESQIKQLIADRIRQIQGKNDSIAEKERQEREAEGKVIPQDFIRLYDRKYNLKERIEIPFLVQAHQIFEYIPKLNAVLLQIEKTDTTDPSLLKSYSSLQLFDIKTRELKMVLDNIDRGTVFSKKDNIVIAIHRSGKILRHDLLNGHTSIIAVDPAAFRDSYNFKLDLSPSGKKLLVADGNQISIVDLQSGAVELFPGKFQRWVKSAKFLNENEVLVLPDILDFVKLDLRTMTESKVKHGSDWGNPYDEVLLTPDYQQLVLKGGKVVVTAPVSALSDIKNNKNYFYDDIDDGNLDSGSALRFIKIVGPGNGILTRFELKESKHYDLLYADVGNRPLSLFTFEEYNNLKGDDELRVWDFSLDPMDGTAVLYALGKRKNFIDVWKVEE